MLGVIYDDFWRCVCVRMHGAWVVRPLRACTAANRRHVEDLSGKLGQSFDVAAFAGNQVEEVMRRARGKHEELFSVSSAAGANGML